MSCCHYAVQTVADNMPMSKGCAHGFLQEEFRQAAIRCLTQRLQVSLASAAQQASAETEKLLETQTELAQRGAHLQVAVRPGASRPSSRNA
jgi:hypothetical protein